MTLRIAVSNFMGLVLQSGGMAMGKRERRRSRKRRRPNPPKPKQRQVEFLGVRVQAEGKVVRWSTGEDFDVEGFAKEMAQRGQAAAQASSAGVAELLEILTNVNPLHLVGQVAAWATVGIPDVDDARERFGLDAKVEFLGGLALSLTQLADEPAGPYEVQRCTNLLGSLFRAERARILGEEIASVQSSSSRSHLDEVRFVARLEHLMDRTQGYTPHLERIIAAVFEPLRTECLAHLGFCPGDLPRLVRAYVATRQEAFQVRLDKARRIPKSELKGLPVSEGLALMSWVIFGLVNLTGDTTARELADGTDLPENEVRAALEALTSEWGCQPGFRRPGEANRFRRYPVLRGSLDRYSIPLPWSILHEVFGWFRDLMSSRDLQSLQNHFHQARAVATEMLVTEALREVFGRDRVLSNVEYPITGRNWAEVDALVWLGDHALVVEVKSHAISDRFRAGDVSYAERHFTDVVDSAFKQSDRAARYFGQGGDKLRGKNGGRRIEWTPVAGTTRIAVSFERIDPLVLVAARRADEKESAPPTWVVCLADLLMITDILREPYEFYAYAALRAELAANPAVALLSEADVLGAFLNDRLESYRNLVEEGAMTAAMLDHHSEELNAYYSATTAGLSADRPAVRLPAGLADTLRDLYTDSREWASRVRELLTPPSAQG